LKLYQPRNLPGGTARFGEIEAAETMAAEVKHHATRARLRHTWLDELALRVDQRRTMSRVGVGDDREATPTRFTTGLLRGPRTTYFAHSSPFNVYFFSRGG